MKNQEHRLFIQTHKMSKWVTKVLDWQYLSPLWTFDTKRHEKRRKTVGFMGIIFFFLDHRFFHPMSQIPFSRTIPFRRRGKLVTIWFTSSSTNFCPFAPFNCFIVIKPTKMSCICWFYITCAKYFILSPLHKRSCFYTLIISNGRGSLNWDTCALRLEFILQPRN